MVLIAWITTTKHNMLCDVLRQNDNTSPKIPRAECSQRPENSQCRSHYITPHHAPNNAFRPLYVPYEMSSAPLAGVIQVSPLADINRDKTPDAVPAAINGVVYPIE